ncbi:hypothetical protein BB560_000128 [Smittium megazygosporum]|uniref:OPT family small oligopeptide transporter n=1 Tax=Smittium megazygosporum TaxID=133381 RepID=A0A2T9ZL84_9FUNG|nr:hypothetical protein BB560_000128 [Smittium megazygosporum]
MYTERNRKNQKFNPKHESVTLKSFSVFTSENKEDEIGDQLHEAIRANVSPTDYPNTPTLTFRVWILGVFLSILLSFVNHFFFFRQNPINLGFSVDILLTFIFGKLMERLPQKRVRILGIRKFTFNLNPGKFSGKEHALLCVFVGAGSSVAYSIEVVAMQDLYYNAKSTFLFSFLLIFSTQLIGYSIAGIAKSVLVQPTIMVWPDNLIRCSMFRALHEKAEKTIISLNNIQSPRIYFSSGISSRKKSRFSFFAVVSLLAFLYHILPGFLFQLLSSISILCFIFPNNTLAQQLGSGTNGLGIGSFSLDWSVIASYLGSPLATPFWAAANIFAGFVLFVWILVPVAYHLNWFDAQKFPIYSSFLFDSSGNIYDILRVTNNNGTLFNEAGYNSYSPIRLSFLFALNYGLAFAIISSAVVHIALNYWPELSQIFSRRFHLSHNDIHGMIMQRYKQIPNSYFLALFAITAGSGIAACNQTQINLPWWGFLTSIVIPSVLLIPFGMVAAVSNVSLGVNVVSEFIAGMVFPGLPIANIVFKSFSNATIFQALELIVSLKLGHYMKIPPIQVFTVQIVGSLISSIVSLTTTKHLFSAIPNICKPSAHPWTCPGTNIFYSASVIWGLIGPQRMFGPNSMYNILLWGLLVGAMLPFVPWILSKIFKNNIAIRYINIPIILTACSVLPPAYTSEFTSWFILAFIFNFLIYKYRRRWWLKYNYIFSASLITGTALSAVFLFYVFQIRGISIDWWGNNKDFHCPLVSNTALH